MRTILNKIMTKVAMSIDGSTNTVSSVRVQSYLVLLPVILMVLVFLIIEIWSFIHAIRSDGDYKLSSEIIIVFGMMLSHHLAVLFSRTRSQSIKEITGGSVESLKAPETPVVPEPDTKKPDKEEDFSDNI